MGVHVVGRVDQHHLHAYAPIANIPPRITSAPMMPQKSTRCCYNDGTLKYVKIVAMTNMLSIASDFSTTSPVR